jgi:hypothetical protein
MTGHPPGLLARLDETAVPTVSSSRYVGFALASLARARLAVVSAPSHDGNVRFAYGKITILKVRTRTVRRSRAIFLAYAKKY